VANKTNIFLIFFKKLVDKAVFDGVLSVRSSKMRTFKKNFKKNENFLKKLLTNDF